MLVLGRDQVRALDRIAVERFGIPGIVLMENAGRGATDVLVRRFAPSPSSRILVVAGPGANGGDGFVVARHLAIRGFSARVLLVGRAASFSGGTDAAANLEIARRMGISIDAVGDSAELAGELAGADLVVDALLGTGLAGDVRGAARAAIEAMNAAGGPVFALDVPSGLDCDVGRPLGIAVRAAATVTFAAMKRGFLEPGAADYTGPVEVAAVGAPAVFE